jgi:hypothetical protein
MIKLPEMQLMSLEGKTELIIETSVLVDEGLTAA